MARNLIISTALRDYQQLTGPAKTALEASGNACLTIYAGTIPDDADDGIGGATALVTLTSDGNAPDGTNGLAFNASLTDGALVKKTGDTWSGTVSNSGAADATFYRWYDYTDDQSTSAGSSDYRAQGTVGTPTGEYDMTVGDVALVDASTFTLSNFIHRPPRDKNGL